MHVRDDLMSQLAVVLEDAVAEVSGVESSMKGCEAHL